MCVCVCARVYVYVCVRMCVHTRAHLVRSRNNYMHVKVQKLFLCASFHTTTTGNQIVGINVFLRAVYTTKLELLQQSGLRPLARQPAVPELELEETSQSKLVAK